MTHTNNEENIQLQAEKIKILVPIIMYLIGMIVAGGIVIALLIHREVMGFDPSLLMCYLSIVVGVTITCLIQNIEKYFSFENNKKQTLLFLHKLFSPKVAIRVSRITLYVTILLLILIYGGRFK